MLKCQGRAVQYLSHVGGVTGKFYNELLAEGHVDSKLLGQVPDSSYTLSNKVNFLNALLLQPPTEQQLEWTEAFGITWRWTEVLYKAVFGVNVIRRGQEEQATDIDERTIN